MSFDCPRRRSSEPVRSCTPSLHSQQQCTAFVVCAPGARGRGVRPYTLSEITVGQQRGVSRIRLRCSETVDKVRPPRAHGLRMLRYVYWWRRRGREGSGGVVDTGHTHERWRGQVLHAPRRRRRRHRRLRVVNGRALELEQQLLGDARDGLVLGAHSDRPEPVQNGCAGRSASVGRRGAAVSRAGGRVFSSPG
jgi:hypothetical protein